MMCQQEYGYFTTKGLTVKEERNNKIQTQSLSAFPEVPRNIVAI